MGPEQQLDEAKEQIADLQDRMLRAAAENENFKKRVERERLARLKYAGEAIFRELLPTVDNLERALDHGEVEGVDAEKNLTVLMEGVQLTLKSLIATLEKFEVKAVSSVGEPFDPKHQEALSMGVHDTIPENHVITDFEKGYYYKDRLLRAAKVVVSSGKSKE
ncbi:MAG: nucleotide exchange factor GrpE [Desulfotalea sp.]|nr:MAG: nucleotide exchange factor GrpE [Desulfotalea sp.]